MTSFEREMLIQTCRAACRNNVLRTEEEAAKLWEEARKACDLLGIDHPEDAVMLLIETR